MHTSGASARTSEEGSHTSGAGARSSGESAHTSGASARTSGEGACTSSSGRRQGWTGFSGDCGEDAYSRASSPWNGVLSFVGRRRASAATAPGGRTLVFRTGLTQRVEADAVALPELFHPRPRRHAVAPLVALAAAQDGTAEGIAAVGVAGIVGAGPIRRIAGRRRVAGNREIGRDFKAGFRAGLRAKSRDCLLYTSPSPRDFG